LPTNWKNKLFFGDNLRILREHIADESVDLVYLDPPFNSNANYNVLFQEKGGEQSAAQITAFEDTWHWTQEAEATYHETVENAPERVGRIMDALRSFLGTSDMQKEAVSAGFYSSQFGNFPKIQILTIEELLNGKKLLHPYRNVATSKRAERQTKTQQPKLFQALPAPKQTPLPGSDFSVTPLLDEIGEEES
jgi:hypothetical protein